MTIGDLLKKQAMSRKGVADYNPTPKQCEAGNYPKEHINCHGFRISIENPDGSMRRMMPTTTQNNRVRGIVG